MVSTLQPTLRPLHLLAHCQALRSQLESTSKTQARTENEYIFFTETKVRHTYFLSSSTQRQPMVFGINSTHIAVRKQLQLDFASHYSETQVFSTSTFHFQLPGSTLMSILKWSVSVKTLIKLFRRRTLNNPYLYYNYASFLNLRKHSKSQTNNALHSGTHFLFLL